MPRWSVVILVLGSALPAPAVAADPTLEQRLVTEVEAGVEGALELLREAVEINSGTLNFDGVRAVGDLFAAEFDRLGFETEWIDGASFERAGHLVARRPGTGGPKVLLIGHLDTVFEADSPFQKWERLSAGEARGPGVTDMKGGNVVMLLALEALFANDLLDGLDLVVVLTGDEEKSGRPLAAARDALREAARGARFAIGFEDGDSNPATAVVSRRGSSSWRLEVRGVPAHSSQVFQPEVGAGAIYEAARILTEFYKELSIEPNLTFNPGLILGGTEVESGDARGTAYGKNNVVAETAIVAGDIRALSPTQYENAKAAMLSIVVQHLPRTSATLTFSDGYPPMAPSDGNLGLLALYDAVSRDLGHGPVTAVDPRQAGAADVSFVADLVPHVLDGVGLMGRGGHTVDEVADLTTLPSQASRAAVLLHRIGAGLVHEAATRP